MRHIGGSKREPLKERDGGGVVLTRTIYKESDIPYSVGSGSENSSKVRRSFSSKKQTATLESAKSEKQRPSISAPIAKSSTNANWNKAPDVPVGQTRTADSPTESPPDPVTTKVWAKFLVKGCRAGPRTTLTTNCMSKRQKSSTTTTPSSQTKSP